MYKFIIVAFFFFLIFLVVHYCCKIENQKTVTCKNLNDLSLGNQLFQIANILSSEKEQDIIFPSWKHNLLFDDRITKLFTKEIPENVQDLTFPNTLINANVLLIRHYFTFNYSLALFVLNQLPQLMTEAIGLHFESNLPKKYYYDSIEYLRQLYPLSPIIIFTSNQDNKQLDFIVSSYENTIVSPFLTEEENFTAFLICNFKILSLNNFAWWIGWLDCRFNSKIIYPLKLDENLQNWICYNENQLIPNKELKKYGGIMKYKNYKHFLALSEAFRRIYPYCKLKVIVEKGDMIVQKDIEFFRVDLVYNYKNLDEFLILMEDFIEPNIVFLNNENQLKFPIDEKEENLQAHTYVINTSLWQLLKSTPQSEKDKIFYEKWCLSFF